MVMAGRTCWLLPQAVLLTVAAVCLGYEDICGFPGSPASGSVWPSKDLYGKGETVSYQCSDGFILIGTAVRRCGEDGEWSGETPLCDDRMVTVGKSLSTETLPGFPSDLALDGNPSTCAQLKRKKPRWWRMDMGERHLVMSVSITVASTKKQRQFTVYVVQVVGTNASYKRCASFNGRFGSKTAVLSCAESKGLEGQFVHIEDNLQEDVFEICEVEVQVLREKYKCGDPDREPYSNHTRPKKGRVHYFCTQGYELYGVQTRECQPTGQWSGVAPECKPIVCEGLLPIPNGYLKLSVVNGNLPLAGTTVFYGCDLGHVLIGQATRVCQKNGSWGGAVPYCKAIDCGRPDSESARGAYKLLNRTTKYGGMAQLLCRGDSEMKGDDPYITCQLDGEWTKPKASCVFASGVPIMPTIESEIKNQGAVTFGMVVAVMMILTVAGTYYYVKRIRAPALPPKPGKLPQPGDAIVPFRTPPSVDRSIPKPPRYIQPYGETGVSMPPVDEEKPEQLLENGVGTMRSLDSSWKTRSLPTDSSSTPKEHLYEEIGQARRSQSDTLDSTELAGDEEGQQEPPPQPLYSSIDVERKRVSRLNRSPESESPEPRTQTEDMTDESMSATPLTSTLDSDATPIQMRELPPIPTEEESSRAREDEEEEEEEVEEELESLEEDDRSAVTPSPAKSPLGEGKMSPRPKTVTPIPSEKGVKTKSPTSQSPTSSEERKSATKSPTPPVRDRSKQRPTSPKERERTESPMPPARDRSKQRAEQEKMEEPAATKLTGRARQRAKKEEDKKEEVETKQPPEEEEPVTSRVRSRQRTSPSKKDEDEPVTSRARSRQKSSPPKKEEEDAAPADESSPPKTRRKREAASKREAPETTEPRDWRRHLRDKPYSYK